MRRTHTPTQSRLLRIALAALPSALIAFSSSFAQATVTVSGVSGASNVEDLGTSAMVVYGGVAGAACTGDADNTCDNCSGAAAGTACNNNRIYGTLRLKITFASDKSDGRILIVPVGSSTSTSGTALTLDGTSATTYTKGSTATAVVTWSVICTSISADGTTCVPTDGLSASGNFWLGIDSNNDNVIDTSEDKAPFAIKVVRAIGQATTATEISTSPGCSSTLAGGVCFFALGSGDEKAFIKYLQGASGFPSGPVVPYRWVRFLYDASAWGNITPGSSHIDLAINGTDVSPRRIEGLTNGQTYYFKVATVDAAKNVGYYTDDSENSVCSIDDFNAGDNNCHIAKPDEVVGVLANQQNCFIATAAYGSSLAPEVDTFRRFRDAVLLQTKLGFKFVRFYYKHSPRYAQIIAQSETLRSLSRAALWPLSTFAHLSLEYGVGIASALFAAGLAALAFILISLRRLVRPTERADRANTGGITRA